MTTVRDKKRSEPPADAELPNPRIGSGSDHTVFLNHLGRPVINLGFVGDYGVYHSSYDDHFWMTQFGDPAFQYHVALTQIWGLTALRLANADLLPYDFGANAAALETFLLELEHNSKIDPQQLPLSNLHQRIAEFQAAGQSLRERTANDLAAGHGNARRLRNLNAQLMGVESNWLDPGGIPGRPWFRHLEFPGLTEAVEQSDWKLAADQAQRLEAALVKNTQLLRAAQLAWESESH